MTIRIDRVVTKTGDRGDTSLGDGTRLRKSAARIDAMGAVDETNAALGLLRLCTKDDAKTDAILAQAQNDLFDIGADLCLPGEAGERFRVTGAIAARYEEAIAAYNQDLHPLNSFVLPGGTAGAAHAHLARTIARRAERTCVALADQGKLNAEIIRALNRLSDLLFVIARRLNDNGAADVLWQSAAAAATPNE